MSGPLQGYRIVEFAGIGPVPFAATMLADMGADVVRIDRPETATSSPTSAAVNVLDRGRQSISLDLKQPAGVGLALELIDEADALLEGFRPGVMERLGLGPRECGVRNQRLVYGRATGWGQTGPYRLRAGHDINYIALSGALSLIGTAGEPPVPPVALVGDYGGGAMFLLSGVLAAMLEAARSGTGQVVDAAILEGAAMLTASIHARRAAGTWLDERGTNKNDTGSHFYNVYGTADDKYVTVGALEPQFYAELLRLTGLAHDPDFEGQWDQSRWPASDPALAAKADRTNWVGLRDRLAEVFRTKTRDEWCGIFAGSDACFAPVLSLGELTDDEHLAARGVVLEIDGVRQPAPAPRFSRTESRVQGPPVVPGHDTDEILAGLGRSADEIGALRDTGVVHRGRHPEAAGGARSRGGGPRRDEKDVTPSGTRSPPGADEAAARLIAAMPLGVTTTSPGRTLSEGEMATLISLTWLHSPMHSDREYARRTLLGDVVVPGVLLVPLAIGLVLGEMQRYRAEIGLSGLAELSSEATFHHPVFFGDTITVSTRFTEARASRSRPGHVVATLEHLVRNQKDDVAARLEKVTLYVGDGRYSDVT